MTFTRARQAKQRSADRSNCSQGAIGCIPDCRVLFPGRNGPHDPPGRTANRDRICINPPGVDTQRWLPGDPRAKQIKSHCDILFVGGDFDRKGGALLLDWASTTNARGWKLHLVTRKRLDIDNPRVCIYNDLNANDPTLMDLYRNADLFVLPTLADCYSIAGIEALSCGVPVILSDSGGISDVVRCGETGYLIKANDPEHLATTIEELIDNPALRRAMGDAGRMDAVERYDAAKNIRFGLERIGGDTP